MEHTWGIPGPAFLWIFLAASALTVTATVLHRRRLFSGGDQAPAASTLSPSHVGYLAGDPERAVLASLTWLRKANAIALDEETGRTTRLGGMPAGGSALDAAVLQATGEGLRPKQIRAFPSVRGALATLQTDLERSGLLVSAEARRASRTGALVLLGLLAIGLLRLIAGLGGGKPVGWLIVTLLALAAVTSILLLRVPRLTSAGKRALSGLRREYAHLARPYQPAWQTYDPVVPALAVGMFGAAALWSADPALADVAGLQQYRNLANSGSAGGGTSCNSGGGGDGGGGCGGGCGG